MAFQYYAVIVYWIAVGVSVCGGRPSYNGYNEVRTLIKNLNGSSWTDCSSSSSSATVTSLSISPSPLVKGSSASVEITVNFNEEVESGTASISLKYKDVIPVKSKTVNICKLEADSCPFQAGSHTLTFTSKIPSYTLSGTYTGLVKATDQDKQQLMCIKISGMYVR